MCVLLKGERAEAGIPIGCYSWNAMSAPRAAGCVLSSAVGFTAFKRARPKANKEEEQLFEQ